ncbi:MAG TPA: hypothetical protein VMV09_01075 [Candidatus Saccharimonadales bacterium]|nr:hypothetical protein [Candidatus Saccharimonadales bacterium]
MLVAQATSLRETKRTNSDGRTVSYLQLAHNRRDPKTSVPKTATIHSFGRADRVDREVRVPQQTGRSRGGVGGL